MEENKKHYVEGAPECEDCRGTGYFDYNAENPKMVHSDCGGTGFQAVEDWSNTQKIEWLVAQYLSGNRMAAKYLESVIDNVLGGGDLSNLLTFVVVKLAGAEKNERKNSNNRIS